MKDNCKPTPPKTDKDAKAEPSKYEKTNKQYPEGTSGGLGKDYSK